MIPSSKSTPTFHLPSSYPPLSFIQDAHGCSWKNLWDVGKSTSRRSSEKALGHRFIDVPELSLSMFTYKVLPERYLDFTSDDRGVDNKWISLVDPPDYQEIVYRGNIVSVTKSILKNTNTIELWSLGKTNLSIPNQGLMSGTTSIGAYAIPNEKIKAYVKTREEEYDLVKTTLERKEIQVEYNRWESEDDEAAVYKRLWRKRLVFLDTSVSLLCKPLQGR